MKNWDYKELLKHPKWQRKRLEIMERAEFACEFCRDDETCLHIHHKKYISGRKPWEYDNSNFICLCEVCHYNVTFSTDKMRLNESVKRLIKAFKEAGVKEG